MRKIGFISGICAAVPSAGFFTLLLTSGIFNMIPYLIHQGLFAEYNESGESIGLIDETSFIILFDTFVSVCFFLLIWRPIRALISRRLNGNGDDGGVF